MGIVARVRNRLGSVLPGAAERQAQTAAYKQAWDNHNDAVRANPPAKLWIALGDSTAQGIGATDHLRGYVGGIRAQLRSADPTWEVINLSVTGARICDVTDNQLPALAELPPAALVTCAVGANDLLRGRLANIAPRLTTLMALLPDQSVVATCPKGIREGLAEILNENIRADALRRGLPVADVWSHTGAPWRGKYFADGFHPNDVGYLEWIAAFAESIPALRAE